jgi:5,10-methylenetetrahydromethanopterin reductase
MSVRFPELGFYALPGHVSHPGAVIDEIRAGAELGFGSVWLSERLNTKSVEVLSGIAASQDTQMGIAAGLVANLPLRNPLVVAAFGSTMTLLTGGRFTLGIGRGLRSLSDAAGVARLNFQLLEDWITILRALWRGESVTYSGPAGQLNGISLGLSLDAPPPIVMAVMGDRTAYWAGRLADGVVYNSLWSTQAIAHSTQIVRQGAADAGRDPASVRVWAIGVTACETSEEDMLNVVVRRMNTYLALENTFDVICAANQWDPSVLEAVRKVMYGRKPNAGKGTLGDENVSRELDDIRRAYELYPPHWIQQGCLVGTAAVCVDRILERFDAGVDGVLLHGSPPQNLASLIDEWQGRRPTARFIGLDPNPGR